MKSINIEQLTSYLEQPSVSNTKDTESTARYIYDWIATFCDTSEVVGDVNPLVRGYIKGNSDKTLCIYGHYDVQSASKDGWDTDPFKPVITPDRIIARGACDNKGQNYAFLTAIEKIVKSGSRPSMNILLLIEGEEEIGSTHLREYLLRDKQGSKADYYLLADGTSPKEESPALYTGSLGVMFAEVIIDNNKGDLHSGIFGSEVPHSVKIMVELLNELYQSSDQLIPKFKEVDQWSFSVTYLSAGVDPAKSIIPGRVKAMISYRFSAGIDSNTIISKLEKYIQDKTKDLDVDTTFTTKVVCEAIEVEESSWIYKTCKSKLSKMKLEPHVGRMQGSLPVVSILKDLYDASPLIISFGSKDNNTHGANEFMRLGNIKKAIRFFEKLLTEDIS